MAKNNKAESSTSRRDILQTIAATGVTTVGLSATSKTGAASIGDVRTIGTVEEIDENGDRTLEIKAENEVSYNFSVTGVLSSVSSPDGTVDRGTATATVENDTHKFVFSGEFTSFDLNGEATVSVNGSRFDPASFPRNTLKIVPRGEVSYDVSASGAVELRTGRAKQSGPRRITGVARQVHELEYEGELTYLDVDGDVQLFKNGSKVDVDAALPSTNPGKIAVRSSKPGRQSYTVEVNGEASLPQNRSPHAEIENGRVSGKVGTSATNVQYTGQVDAIEHPDAGTVTINRQANRVKCSATASGKVTFELQSSEGIHHDGTISEAQTIVVASGESKTVQYFDDITGVTVENLEVTLAPDEYRSKAEISERLQLAADLEREQAFKTLEETAREHGRVRRDAGGIVASSVLHPISESVRPRFVVGFKLTDLTRSDQALLSLGKAVETSDVLDPTLTYEWKQNGFTERLEFQKLPTERNVAVSTSEPSAIETETVEYDVESYQQNYEDAKALTTVPDKEKVTAQDFQTPDDVSTNGSWIGAIIDGVSDLADSLVGITKDALNKAIEEAVEVTNVSKEDFVIKSGKIVANSTIAAQAIATEFMERGWLKALWKVRIKGLSTLVSLANTGILTDLSDDGEVTSCNQCVAVVRILVDVGICGYGSAYVCTTLGIATASVGGIACAVFVGTICNSVLNDVEDVKTLCGEGNSSYPQGSWC